MKTNIEIKTPYIELDSFLKFAAVAYTGGEAKLMIKDGIVSVNGEVCTQRKKKLYPEDTVSVEGETFIVKKQG